MYTFSLPLPPIDGEYLKQGPRGAYIGRAGQRYGRAVKAAVCRQPVAELSPYKGAELAVRVIVNPPTREAGPNYRYGREALLDALTRAGLWGSAAQVHALLEVTEEPIAGGAVKVTVTLMDNTEPAIKIAA